MTPAKRIMDIVFASLLMILLAPVFVVVVVILLIKQGRPLFFVGERMKSPSTSFGLIKFRTMTVTQDDSGVSGGDKQARITPIGARLRAKRLDELPQLWNILKGDISFVGPRPPLREYVERYPTLYTEVLRMRPGVTGLATLVYHRHEAALLARCASSKDTDDVYTRRCIPTKAKLDILYQRNQSLCFDFLLTFQTIGELLRRG